jgi:hypothetical protein
LVPRHLASAWRHSSTQTSVLVSQVSLQVARSVADMRSWSHCAVHGPSWDPQVLAHCWAVLLHWAARCGSTGCWEGGGVVGGTALPDERMTAPRGSGGGAFPWSTMVCDGAPTTVLWLLQLRRQVARSVSELDALLQLS